MSEETIPDRRERVLPEVERSQEELREALEELQLTVRSRFDLRRRIAEDPMPWLIGGFLAGWWMSRSR